MLQFQQYVRQRLSEVNARMPPAMGLKEKAELHFLEQAVIDDHMPKARRELRDPLKVVHTLPTLPRPHTNPPRPTVTPTLHPTPPLCTHKPLIKKILQ